MAAPLFSSRSNTMDNGYFHRRSLSEERPLPSPTDTPYDTPRVVSPRASSYGTTAPTTPLTNSSVSIQHALKRQSLNGDAQYNPEQFTPTLQASLVSQILSLRRELETKRDFIDDLEANLASTRAENDTLQSNLRRQARETRNVKRDLQQYEEGTQSHIETLGKELNDAREANTELRRRLDINHNRLRSREEEAFRFKSTLDDERTNIAKEKRTLERRAESAEQKLKAVVEEVAASQAASLDNSRVEERDVRPAEETQLDDDHLLGSPQSARSTRHQRNDTLGSLRQAKPSLADELDYSDSDYDNSDNESTHHRERPKTPNNRHSTALEQQSPTPVRSAHKRDRTSSNLHDQPSKVLGMVSAFEEQVKREERASKRDSMVSRTLSQASSKLRSSIRLSRDFFGDLPTAQFSQPTDSSALAIDDNVEREPVEFPRPSRTRARSDPTLALLQLPLELRGTMFKPSLALLAQKIEAIESQKSPPQPVELISTSTQTDFAEPEPPALPEYVSIGIQTVAQKPPPPPTRAPPPPPTTVPAIAVHPPSNPPSPPMARRLPPQVKSIGVQTPSDAPIGMRSIAMQTDVIRVDRRLAKLPSHLLPSTLDEQERLRQQAKDKSRAIFEAGAEAKNATVLSLTQLNLTSSGPLPPLEEDDDDDEIAEEGDRAIRSRVRGRYASQSMPASPTIPTIPERGLGIDDATDDLYSSDTEYATRTAVARSSHGPGRHGKRFEPPAPLPEDDQVAFAPTAQAKKRISMASQSTGRSSTDRKRFSRLTTSSDPASEYQSRLGLMNRQGSVRSRSPSMGSVASSSNFSKISGPRPPFIIPARRSSREQYAKIRIQRSERGSISPRRSGRSSPERSVNNPKQKQRFRKKSPHNFLRKTRSSAFLEGMTTSGRPPPVPSITSRSVPKVTASSVVEAPYTSDAQKREIGIPEANNQRLSTLIPTGGASVGSAIQHDVVDAITATTIGEWMFKYMRKRSTFGGTENNPEPGKTSDARHKRWVWLSPYERTVMWSNKQPRTNAALMGKAGRRLPIQSVLDVKDETPPPKEAKASGLFNRSILILTPDRALKFTAPTKERHYLWLTALSYLAHQSAQGVQEFPKYAFQPPNSPTVDSSVTLSSGQSRASSIRNPLRSTRSKAPSRQSSGVATPVVGQQADANNRREPPKVIVPDYAFAPTVPRVPHSRKRSQSATGVMPLRGKPPMVQNNPLSAHPVTTMNSPTISINGDHGFRFQSVSAASSRRSVKQPDEDPAVAAVAQPVHFVPERSHLSPRELSPPPSGPRMSAEFGGNNNFFDAVGVVRMDAFSKQANTRPQSRRSQRQELQDQDHLRQDSDSSFVGPPDIGRHRAMRQNNSPARDPWKNF